MAIQKVSEIGMPDARFGLMLSGRHPTRHFPEKAGTQKSWTEDFSAQLFIFETYWTAPFKLSPEFLKSLLLKFRFQNHD
jgi:hypothetical protein